MFNIFDKKLITKVNAYSILSITFRELTYHINYAMLILEHLY